MEAMEKEPEKLILGCRNFDQDNVCLLYTSYGKRAGYSTLVLEKNPMSGGQVLNTCEVDNYLGLPGIKDVYKRQEN